jgi:hypothetical protein
MVAVVVVALTQPTSLNVAVTAHANSERGLAALLGPLGAMLRQAQLIQILLALLGRAAVAALPLRAAMVGLVLSPLAAVEAVALVQLAVTAALAGAAKSSSPVSTRRLAWNISS